MSFGQPAGDAVRQMRDIGEAELFDQRVAEAAGPVAGPAIEHDRRVGRWRQGRNPSRKPGWTLAACFKGGQGLGAGDDPGFLPFLLAPDVDDDNALFLRREKLGRRRLAKRHRRAHIKELDLEDQRRVRRDDPAGARRPVAELRRTVRRRNSPTFMPSTPCSQPRITWPAPMVKLKAWPRGREASNVVPSSAAPRNAR